MADVQPTQTLKDFIQETTQSLRSGKITTEEALLSARQFATLRGLINPEDLQKILTADSAKLEEYLIKLFEGVTGNANVPSQVQTAVDHEIPDEPDNMQEVIVRAKYLAKAREELISTREERLRLLKKSYIKRLVDAWIAKNKEQLSEEKAQEISQKLKEKLEMVDTRGVDSSQFTQSLTQDTEEAFKTTGAWSPEISVQTKPINETFVATAEQIRNTTTSAATALVQEPALFRPDIFVRLVHEKSADPGVSVGSVIYQSYKTARAAEAFSALVEKSEDITRPAVLFNANANFFQRPLAKVADLVLSVLPQERRETFVQAFLGRSLEKAVDRASNKLGQGVIGSSVFQQAIKSAGLSFGYKGAGVSALKNAFLDLGSFLAGNQQQAFVAYFDLFVLNEKLPPWQKIFPSGLLPTGFKKLPSGKLERVTLAATQQIPQNVIYLQFFWQQFYLANRHTTATTSLGYRLDFLNTLGSWAFRWGAKKAAGEGIKKAGLLVAEGAGARVGIKATITLLGIVLPEPVSKLVLLGSALLAPIVKGVSGLIGKLFKGDFWQLGTAQRALKSYFGADRLPQGPKQWHENPVVIVALIVLAPVLLTGFTFFSGEAARTSALVDPRFKGEGSFDNAPVPVECQGDNLPKPAATGVKTASFGGRTYAFPVGEFDRTYYTCGHWDGAYATDIGITGVNTGDPGVHLPVVAYTSGKILNVAAGDSKGGKYVVLAGDDGRYYYYAHNCALYVQKDQGVAAGEVIAASGNTGSAADTPEHLHFAISSGSTFYNGGTTCPSKDFQEKLGIFRCSKAQQCP